MGYLDPGARILGDRGRADARPLCTAPRRSCSAAQRGRVVDGVVSGPPTTARTCFLSDDATVKCSTGIPSPSPIEAAFTNAGRIVALASDTYSPSMCAVTDDGALWCVGSNGNGRLGTGSTADLGVETQVQPPGSVMVDCR
jgi:hypothetical protein